MDPELDVEVKWCSDMLELVNRTFGSKDTELHTKQFVLDVLETVGPGSADPHVREMFRAFLTQQMATHNLKALAEHWAKIQVAKEDREQEEHDAQRPDIERAQRIEAQSAELSALTTEGKVAEENE